MGRSVPVFRPKVLRARFKLITSLISCCFALDYMYLKVVYVYLLVVHQSLLNPNTAFGSFMLQTTRCPEIVVQRTFRLSTASHRSRGIDRNILALLRSTVYLLQISNNTTEGHKNSTHIFIVPDLSNDRPPSIFSTHALLRLIVPRARAPNVW